MPTPSERAPERPTVVGWSSGRVVAFAVTWTSYATYYFGRKGWSVAKATLESSVGARALHGVETAYLLAYALGQYVSGWLGDRFQARWLIGIGMLISAFACFAFGASGVGTLFIGAWFLNGLAQSTGWPGNIKAMAEWTPPNQRGAVMGVWSTCYQIGGILATDIAARLLRAYGWSWAFYGPALGIAAVGVLVLIVLRPGPLAGQAGDAGAVETKASTPTTDLADARHRLLRSPLIWSYGFSYFCIKLIRYSLLFWLPYYFATVLHWEKVRAADVSTAFEWGGVAGAVAIGVISDRLRLPRAAVAAASLVGLAGAFSLLASGTTSQTAIVLELALAGFLLYGPDALVSGAAAQDAGGPQAAALAAGLVNGIGSVGAVLQEGVTVYVSGHWGWNALFGVFVGLSILSALCLIPAFRARRDGLETAAAVALG